MSWKTSGDQKTETISKNEINNNTKTRNETHKISSQEIGMLGFSICTIWERSTHTHTHSINSGSRGCESGSSSYIDKFQAFQNGNFTTFDAESELSSATHTHAEAGFRVIPNGANKSFQKMSWLILASNC